MPKRRRKSQGNDLDISSFFGELANSENAILKKKKVEEVVSSKPQMIVSTSAGTAPQVRHCLQPSKNAGLNAGKWGEGEKEVEGVGSHHVPIDFDVDVDVNVDVDFGADCEDFSALYKFQSPMSSSIVAERSLLDDVNEKMQRSTAAPLRKVGGRKWRDETLLEWPENDFRLFIGNLDKETKLDQLQKAFQHYPSFAKAKIVMNSIPEPGTSIVKCKGFGFISFLDPMDCAKALRLEQNKYCGLRPMHIKKSKTCP